MWAMCGSYTRLINTALCGLRLAAGNICLKSVKAWNLSNWGQGRRDKGQTISCISCLKEVSCVLFTCFDMFYTHKCSAETELQHLTVEGWKNEDTNKRMY